MDPLFWDDSHHALHRAASRWVEARIRPYADAWEEAGAFPRELYGEAGAAGLLGVHYPEAVGGAGGDVFHQLIVTEALVRGGSVGTAVGLGSHSIALPPVLALGTPAQVQRFVPPVVRGERVAALAITEPGAGSDVAGITCRAERRGDAWVVNGSKTFITSGARADLVTLAVRTGGEGAGGLSLLVVERGTPGFTSGAPLRKMGWWASDTTELFFEDCRVPAENLLGAEGSGFMGIVTNFVGERLLLAATCVAVARLALEEAQRHARVRQAFGKPLRGHQVVRHMLAEMRTQERVARSAVAVAAERVRRAGPEGALSLASEVAMVKNAATEACSWVCDRAVQVLGGMGLMRESLVERLYRDARVFGIGGGSTEIMNELIARWSMEGAG